MEQRSSTPMEYGYVVVRTFVRTCTLSSLQLYTYARGVAVVRCKPITYRYSEYPNHHNRKAQTADRQQASNEQRQRTPW